MPIDPNGQPDGPRPADPAEPPTPAPEAPPGQRGANVTGPSADPAAPQAAGEPGSLPPIWCRRCQAEVQPIDKGVCPRCRTFLRLNFAARKHPINRLRVQQILDKLIADYQPKTTLQYATCEHLAKTLEQLETIKAGSTEWDRLVNRSQLLGKALEESTSRVATPDLDLSDDEMIEKTTSLLRQMLAEREAVQRAEEHIADSARRLRDDQHSSEGDVSSASPQGDGDPRAHDEICKFCHRLCVGPDHFAYDVFHWDDPAERAKRDRAATAVMMRQIGKPLPDWYGR